MTPAMTFEEWNNTPVKRAQVFTWRLHCKFTGINGNAILVDMDRPIPPALLFRALPKYRPPEVLALRRAVALEVRAVRLGGRIKLPAYNPRTGNYE